MDSAFQDLLNILMEARALLARPDNDFSRSSWHDADHALAEIDGLTSQFHAGKLPTHLAISILFAPTGPMQETSLSSGWSQEFLILASRFDHLEAKIWPASARN
jgi:hypothetical protein